MKIFDLNGILIHEDKQRLSSTYEEAALKRMGGESKWIKAGW